jgi:hypothetical protein
MNNIYEDGTFEDINDDELLIVFDTNALLEI